MIIRVLYKMYRQQFQFNTILQEIKFITLNVPPNKKMQLARCLFYFMVKIFRNRYLKYARSKFNTLNQRRQNLRPLTIRYIIHTTIKILLLNEALYSIHAYFTHLKINLIKQRIIVEAWSCRLVRLPKILAYRQCIQFNKENRQIGYGGLKTTTTTTSSIYIFFYIKY